MNRGQYLGVADDRDRGGRARGGRRLNRRVSVEGSARHRSSRRPSVERQCLQPHTQMSRTERVAADVP